MAAQIPLKLVTSPSNIVARLDGLATGGTDYIEPDLVLGEVTGTAGVPVGTNMTQTLTNKTLTAPKIDEVFVGASRAHKFLAGGDNYVITRGQAAGGAPQVGVDGSDANINLALVTKGTGVPIIRYNGAGSVTVADVSTAQTLTNKTLTAPVIADFTAAPHDHEDATGGGQLNANLCFTAGSGVATVFSVDLAAGSAIAATTTNVQALSSTVPTIPIGALVVTSSYRVSITGKYTTDGAGRTCAFILSRDGTNHYYTTGAITLGDTLADQRFRFVFIMTCTVTGGSGSVRTILQDGYARGATSPSPAPVVVGGPTALTVDTGATNNITMLGQFGAASGAANTVTMESFLVEKLN